MILIFILCIIPYSLSEEWTIHVLTGNQRFAGTDSNVYIRLFTSKYAQTDEYQLTHENWVIGNNDFPIRNLFETGGHDRFRIVTDKIDFIEKVQIRRDSFLSFQSDWLLDQIIAERNRDNFKIAFKCNCWFRKNSFITIPIRSDSRSIDKNDLQKSPSNNNQTIVILLLVLIAVIACIICCIHEYTRRKRDHSFESTQEEVSTLDEYPPQLPGSAAAAAPPPPLLIDTINRWKDIRHTIPSSSNTRVFQQISVRTVNITSTDEPPAYADLFPDSSAL